MLSSIKSNNIQISNSTCNLIKAFQGKATCILNHSTGKKEMCEQRKEEIKGFVTKGTTLREFQ